MKRLNLLTGVGSPTLQSRILGSVGDLTAVFPEVRLLAAALVLLVTVFAVEFAAVEMTRARVKSRRVEISRARTLTSRLKIEEQEIAKQRAELERKRRDIEREIALIRAARQPEVPVSTVMAQLGQAIPPDVWISKLTLEGESLKLVGSSNQTGRAADVMAGLDKSKRFRESTFGYTQRAADGERALFTFEIKTQVIFQEPEPGK